MNYKNRKVEKHSSPIMAKLASQTLRNPGASIIDKRLSGSVLSQAGIRPKLLQSKVLKKRPILFLSDF